MKRFRRNDKTRGICILLAVLMLSAGAARAGDCVQARKLSLGDTVACDGILIPPDMGRSMLALKDEAALSALQLEECESQLDWCMGDIETMSKPSVSPLIWAVVGGIVMLAAGLGIGFALGVYVDR